DYIPQNCFIARSHFNSDRELLDYLKNMDEKTYNSYIQNIKNFLTNKNITKLSRKFIAQEIRSKLHLNNQEKKYLIQETCQIFRGKKYDLPNFWSQCIT